METILTMAASDTIRAWRESLARSGERPGICSPELNIAKRRLDEAWARNDVEAVESWARFIADMASLVNS